MTTAAAVAPTTAPARNDKPQAGPLDHGCATAAGTGMGGRGNAGSAGSSVREAAGRAGLRGRVLGPGHARALRPDEDIECLAWRHREARHRHAPPEATDPWVLSRRNGAALGPEDVNGKGRYAGRHLEGLLPGRERHDHGA